MTIRGASITTEQYRRLYEMGVIGPIELLDGVIVCGPRFALALSAEQRTAAAAAGVELPVGDEADGGAPSRRDQAEKRYPRYALAYLRYLAGERETVPTLTRPGIYDGITAAELPAVQARVEELVAEAARRRPARGES
jgi:hypothetical protein